MSENHPNPSNNENNAQKKRILQFVIIGLVVAAVVVGILLAAGVFGTGEQQADKSVNETENTEQAIADTAEEKQLPDPQFPDNVTSSKLISRESDASGSRTGVWEVTSSESIGNTGIAAELVVRRTYTVSEQNETWCDDYETEPVSITCDVAETAWEPAEYDWQPGTSVRLASFDGQTLVIQSAYHSFMINGEATKIDISGTYPLQKAALVDNTYIQRTETTKLNFDDEPLEYWFEVDLPLDSQADPTIKLYTTGEKNPVTLDFKTR
ncbi:MAG: hypothetical protein IK127_05170 [Clostridia bacterium]|nr:hypothetical protein [Clostridia bacterium]